MAKSEVITLRVAPELKAQLERRALRENRSLTAQIEHDLRARLDDVTERGGKGSFLGRFAECQVPSDDEIRNVRRELWGRLGNRDVE